MRENRKVVVVTDKTRIRLEEMRLEMFKNGVRQTIGGIVDHIVKEAYDNRNP